MLQGPTLLWTRRNWWVLAGSLHKGLAFIRGPEVRPVDDFTRYGITKEFGSPVKVQLYSVDHVVAWSRAWI